MSQMNASERLEVIDVPLPRPAPPGRPETNGCPDAQTAKQN